MTTQDPVRTPRRSPSGDERRRDPERTKARIVEAATEVFGAHGFAAARTGDIAERAGVNKQLISYYFGGKEGLYAEVVATVHRRNQAISDPDRPLADVVSDFAMSGVRDRAAARLLLWENLTDDLPSPDELAEQRAAFAHQLEYVRHRQRQGDFPADLDPEYVLLLTMGAAIAPTALPRIARGLFDEDPSSAEFLSKVADQLAILVRHLRRG